MRARAQSMSAPVRLSGVPVFVGIVFLRPGLMLAALSCGLVAAGARHGVPAQRTLVRSVVCLLAAGAGTLTYDHWSGRASPAQAGAWPVCLLTVTVMALLEMVLMVVVMPLVDRHWRRPAVVPALVQLGVYVAACSAVGLAAVSVIWVNAWGVVLFLAIAVAWDLACRATLVARQRYRNLEKLYDLTRHLSGITEAREVMAAVVQEARSLMGADRAEVVVPLGPTMGRLVARCSSREEDQFVFREGALSSVDNLASHRGALLLNGRCEDQELVAAMRELDVSETLLAPLQRGEPGAGYLLVADRALGQEGFKPSDLRFFETLAANAGVALRSSELMEQLRREVSVRQYQARHDPLTELPNRLLFSERLQQALTCTPGAKVAVMLIDLDGFKDVNDTLGHHTGDAILKEMAGRLLPFMSESSLVARLGGDEFAVLLVDAADDVVVETTADEVLNAITQPCAVQGLLLDIRASMGVAIAPASGRGRDASNLMRHADVAMYSAKESGGGARLYDPTEDRSTLRRLTLATELRRAIERQELEVWYQPVVQLGTGGVLGCEALLRWDHNKFGPISPAEFIPVAESVGLIDPLTWMVLDRALHQLKAWRCLVPGLTMAVNLSARSLTNEVVTDRVAEALQRAGVPPEALTLELTESCMMCDPARSENSIRNLRELGVNLSIDDYGTGFSSLSRLKLLPFRDLKIDRSFVKEMAHDKSDEAIVRSTIELARSLGRTVTAEGVEDKVTLQQLANLGCHAAQGYYLARPLPASACEAWLKSAVLLPASVAPTSVAPAGATLGKGNPV
jgi:diguanylate cyclase (GGDEF)-like protein